VNAANGFHLWSERYDREIKDVFAVQEEIAQAIARRLRATFARAGDGRVEQRSESR
jgi:TolB-like protein